MSKQVLEKVHALDGKEDTVLLQVALEEEIDSELKEQLLKAEECDKVIEVEELMQPEGVLVKKVLLEEEV